MVSLESEADYPLTKCQNRKKKGTIFIEMTFTRSVSCLLNSLAAFFFFLIVSETLVGIQDKAIYFPLIFPLTRFIG